MCDDCFVFSFNNPNKEKAETAAVLTSSSYKRHLVEEKEKG
jgi:hypothetical protein